MIATGVKLIVRGRLYREKRFIRITILEYHLFECNIFLFLLTKFLLDFIYESYLVQLNNVICILNYLYLIATFDRVRNSKVFTLGLYDKYIFLQ